MSSKAWPAILLSLLVGNGLAQTQGLPDAEAYESFFRQVAQSKTGDTFYPRFPAPPIVLTESENQALRLLASDCIAKVRPIKTAIGAVRMELVLQSIGAGEDAEKLKRDFADLQAQQSKVVLEHAELLKAAFGPARFPMVEEFVRTGEAGQRSPFAPSGPRPKMAAKR